MSKETTPTPRIEEAIGGISSSEFELMQKCSRVIDVGRDLEVELTAASETIERLTAELAAMRSGEVVGWLISDADGNDDFCNNPAALHQFHYRGGEPIPLYRSPAPAPDTVVEALPDAARDVLSERERQKAVEGWTEAHDDQHGDGQMADAAACYALENGRGFIESFWPWDWKWWKPKDPRRNLVRAGALIIAEIERIDRAALTGQAKKGEE